MNRGDELARNMTIREAFAMEAMGGLLIADDGDDYGRAAYLAMKAADALLAELERTNHAD